jgi:hypothetical protein
MYKDTKKHQFLSKLSDFMPLPIRPASRRAGRFVTKNKTVHFKNVPTINLTGLPCAVQRDLSGLRGGDKLKCTRIKLLTLTKM